MSSSKEVTKETFTFVWNIKNLRFSTLKTGEFITSPEFSVPQFHFTTWYLKLYPKGETIENEEYMACFLRRTTDNGPKTITMDFSLTIMSYNKQFQKRNFDKNDSLGYANFSPGYLYCIYKFSFEIVLKMQYFPDKTSPADVTLPSLGTVEELKPLMNYQTNQSMRKIFSFPTQCLAQTRFCSKKKILQYSYSTDSSLLDTDGGKQTIPLIFSDDDPSLIITLYNKDKDGKSKIAVNTRRVKNKFVKPFVIGSQLSVFINKTEYLSMSEEEHTFYAEKENEVFCLEGSIDVSGLKERCKECTSNVVTFVFEFHFSTGDTISDTVWSIEFQKDSITPKSGVASPEMLRLYTNKELCDIILKVKDKTFEAHKVNLAAMSPVFSAMFRSGLAETETNTVDIVDMLEDTVEEMLYFMYTGTLRNLEFQGIKKLFAAADKYQITSLMNQCRDYLIDNLTDKNACEILCLADTHQDMKLKKAAVEVIFLFKNCILSSEEWGSLAKHHSAIAIEVLTQMCLKL